MLLLLWLLVLGAGSAVEARWGRRAASRVWRWGRWEVVKAVWVVRGADEVVVEDGAVRPRDWAAGVWVRKEREVVPAVVAAVVEVSIVSGLPSSRLVLLLLLLPPLTCGLSMPWSCVISALFRVFSASSAACSFFVSTSFLLSANSFSGVN